MKVKSEREVAQLCPTLSDPMDYSLPGSSIHGIFQARVLEWVVIAILEYQIFFFFEKQTLSKSLFDLSFIAFPFFFLLYLVHQDV